tara:strand:+ start:1182 stop:1460 length:279 start_codon:yes stop_codon:yes gene_type:complete
MPKENVKLQSIEIDSLKEIQQSYRELQTTIGAVYLRRQQLELQLDEVGNQLVELEVQFTNMRNQEQELLKNLEEKYGKGSLDINTGEFTPNS